MITVIKFALMLVISILISHVVIMGVVSFVAWENYILTDFSVLDEASRLLYIMVSFFIISSIFCFILTVGD
jgi:hypothetical protein